MALSAYFGRVDLEKQWGCPPSLSYNRINTAPITLQKISFN